MEPQVRDLVDISGSHAALSGRADLLLEKARWAAQIFQRFWTGFGRAWPYADQYLGAWGEIGPSD